MGEEVFLIFSRESKVSLSDWEIIVIEELNENKRWCTNSVAYRLAYCTVICFCSLSMRRGNEGGQRKTDLARRIPERHPKALGVLAQKGRHLSASKPEKPEMAVRGLRLTSWMSSMLMAL